ncbi:MAG: 5-formyltetrahydrofolate cyclo-ligase [Treponemataceae bacterium]|nr:5-formyltetrahydrofolate cyclo-ligase [Treponemataceae bacterium]
MREALASLDPIAKAFESAGLCMRFIQSETYKSSRAIFGFMPLKDEVDVLPILRAAIADGKKVLLPKIVCEIKSNCKAEFSASAKNSTGEIEGGKMDFYFVERDPIEETEEGAHGIFEPKPSCQKADIEKLFAEMHGEKIVVLVPGLAFTKEGFRLGRGGGYYDRFLERLSRISAAIENSEAKVELVGVCYAAQILENVPRETHDARVDCVVRI